MAGDLGRVAVGVQSTIYAVRLSSCLGEVSRCSIKAFNSLEQDHPYNGRYADLLRVP